MRSWLNSLILAALVLAAPCAWAQSRVDQLSGATTPLAGTETIPTCQGCNSSTPLVATPVPSLWNGPNTWADPILCCNASGSWAPPTTGTISASSNSLTVANASGWIVGQGIWIYGAGTSGGNFFTSVTAISGTTFTLAANAGTSVTNAFVQSLAATTTGSGSSSSNPTQLTVASDAGWSVGMGINVTGAGASSANLITSISSCGVSSGPCTSTTFVLATSILTTVSGATVQHDDTAAVQEALNNYLAVKLRYGNYNISSALDITSPNLLVGDGTGATFLWNLGKTNDSIYVTYSCNEATTERTCGGFRLADFQIIQLTASPTAGYAIHYAYNGTSGFYVQNGIAENIVISGTYFGIGIGSNVIIDWFRDITIANTVGGGIYYDNPSPAGDVEWTDISETFVSAPTDGCFYVVSSDTQVVTDLKCNQGGSEPIELHGGGTVANIRFVNPSIEGYTGDYAMDLTDTNNIVVVGGELYQQYSASGTFNLTGASGYVILGVNGHGTGAPIQAGTVYNYISSPQSGSGGQPLCSESNGQLYVGSGGSC